MRSASTITASCGEGTDTGTIVVIVERNPVMPFRHACAGLRLCAIFFGEKFSRKKAQGRGRGRKRREGRRSKAERTCGGPWRARKSAKADEAPIYLINLIR